MNTKIKFIGMLVLAATFFTACVKDGLEECPEGAVKVNLYVEKFRNKSQDPLADRETNFSERITHLRYYLYKEGKMYDEGILTKFLKNSMGCHTFNYSGLEYGNYKMVIIANSAKTALSGDASNADNLVITYPGSDLTEDYFTAVFPFTVNTNDIKEYDVGMLRAQGVIRYTFQNMPEDVRAIQIAMQNVHTEKWVTGDYKNICEATRRYTIQNITPSENEEDEYIIGTFPTPNGERSVYYLSLFREGDTEPYLRQMISDTLTVARNQLLDIKAIFSDGNFDFVIDLDSKWDGSMSGGETGLQ